MNSAFEEIERYNVGASSLALGSDMRHVFVKDLANNDSYTLLDIGVWNERSCRSLTSICRSACFSNDEMKANKAAHVVSHNNQTAVFHDGSGLVEVFDAKSLSTNGAPIPVYTYQGKAHHGVAIPLSDDTLAVSLNGRRGKFARRRKNCR